MYSSGNHMTSYEFYLSWLVKKLQLSAKIVETFNSITKSIAGTEFPNKTTSNLSTPHETSQNHARPAMQSKWKKKKPADKKSRSSQSRRKTSIYILAEIHLRNAHRPLLPCPPPRCSPSQQQPQGCAGAGLPWFVLVCRSRFSKPTTSRPIAECTQKRGRGVLSANGRGSLKKRRVVSRSFFS